MKGSDDRGTYRWVSLGIAIAVVAFLLLLLNPK